jgi:hypothetical protein
MNYPPEHLFAPRPSQDPAGLQASSQNPALEPEAVEGIQAYPIPDRRFL